MMFLLGAGCVGYAAGIFTFMFLGLLGSAPWYHYPLCLLWPLYLVAIWVTNR